MAIRNGTIHFHGTDRVDVTREKYETYGLVRIAVYGGDDELIIHLFGGDKAPELWVNGVRDGWSSNV